MVLSYKIISFYKLIISILICECVGLISGLISKTDIDTWFNTIDKPDWNPPNYLFVPLWIVLYFLMAISLWLVWKKKELSRKISCPILIFATQLFLNFWWCILFFKCHSPFLAFIEALIMLLIILITIDEFYAISKIAAWLLLPYVLWVSFATFLNYSIWILNK